MLHILNSGDSVHTFILTQVPRREIEGKVYVGEVKEKEKAKKQYDKAVASGKTAGLVKYDKLKDFARSYESILM